MREMTSSVAVSGLINRVEGNRVPHLGQSFLPILRYFETQSKQKRCKHSMTAYGRTNGPSQR